MRDKTTGRQSAEYAVRHMLSMSIPTPMFSSLVDLVEKYGADTLAGSTLLLLVNAGDFQRADLEFSKLMG